MKRLKNISRLAFSAVLATLGFSSCQDWLTIYPQTQIVEENFWEDKNDLEGVRYAAYKQMCGTLDKIVLWGDLRSDSYTLSTSDEDAGTRNFYSEVREGRIDRDSANAYFDWSGFYTTINYCNKVLYHGQEVLDRDKQFTSSEWNQMKAEMTALRALNYFYLLRSFKDIPYTTKVINKDTEVEYFSATNQLVVLDSLITDVESIQGQAANRRAKKNDTKGLMTNTAIYALLSDMYLWRASLHQGRGLTTDTVIVRNVANTANIRNLTSRNDSVFVVHTVEDDYQACIEYADKSLAKLADQTLQNNKGYGVSLSETENYGLENCDMLKNEFTNFSRAEVTAYDRIFGIGNSDESIFELQFNNVDSRTNDVVTSQWGYGNKVHLAISDQSIAKIYTSNMNLDSRTWFSAWSKASSVGGTAYTNALPGLYCFKWRNAEFRIPESGKAEDISISTSGDGDNYHNWIIYRMSDVMLQKAEALACLSTKDNGDAKDDEYAKDARRIVNAIHRRWYCPDEYTTYVPSNDVTDNNGCLYHRDNNTIGNIDPAKTTELAVLNERQIEFLGEGKRWFDLVRYAERHAGGMDGTKDAREWTEEKPIGSGSAGVKKMVTELMSATFTGPYATSLINRMKNRYGLYNLIYYMEIKASVDNNGYQHLQQNPVWNKSQYD